MKCIWFDVLLFHLDMLKMWEYLLHLSWFNWLNVDLDRIPQTTVKSELTQPKIESNCSSDAEDAVEKDVDVEEFSDTEVSDTKVDVDDAEEEQEEEEVEEEEEDEEEEATRRTSGGRKGTSKSTSKTSSSSNSLVKARCNCDQLLAIDCHLETKELWDKFHELGTEMIITKTGR